MLVPKFKKSCGFKSCVKIIHSVLCAFIYMWESFAKIMNPHFIWQDGVVLGADTRATEDTVVADKNCSKIHYISKNI